MRSESNLSLFFFFCKVNAHATLVDWSPASVWDSYPRNGYSALKRSIQIELSKESRAYSGIIKIKRKKRTHAERRSQSTPAEH